MKRSVKRIIALVVALVLCLGTVTTASARSSLYLSAYRAWLSPASDGAIRVAVDVQARTTMSEVGASRIQILESQDGGESWTTVGVYVKSLFPEMVATNTYYYEDYAVTHSGTPGYQYYAVITIYAGDSTGYDTRNYQTTVVTAIE